MGDRSEEYRPTVVIWDDGEFVPIGATSPEDALLEGKLTFELSGRILRGAFTLARMKSLAGGTGKEWLLIKKKDSHAKTGFNKNPLTPAKLKSLKDFPPVNNINDILKIRTPLVNLFPEPRQHAKSGNVSPKTPSYDRDTPSAPRSCNFSGHRADWSRNTLPSGNRRCRPPDVRACQKEYSGHQG
jgi:hypothetical protein